MGKIRCYAENEFGGADTLIFEPFPKELPLPRKAVCFLGKRKSKEADGCFRLSAKTKSNVLCSDVVEMRRIELLSENLFAKGSPSAVCV